MDAEQFFSLAAVSAIPAAIAWVAWRHRSTKPIAARLFLGAAVCFLLQIGAWQIEQLTQWNVIPITDDADLSLVPVSDWTQAGSRGWWREMLRQFSLSSFEMIAWYWMSVAILRQPDERPKTV